MSKVAGYVIVRGEGTMLEAFSKFTGSGIAAEWHAVFCGSHNRFAIYSTHIEATEVLQNLPASCAGGFAGARVEPLLIGRNKIGESYLRFLDKCTRDLARPEGSSMTPGHDEAAAQVFAQPEELHSGILQELLETSSVTVVVGGERFVVALHVAEAEEEDE